jgi:Lsr2
MATRTTITLEDDLDGSPAERTVSFGLGTAEYEIDLSAANVGTFRTQLAPFVDHARKVGRSERTRLSRTSASRHETAVVRAWAREHGIQISARGRIPASVTEQYEAASTGR